VLEDPPQVYRHQACWHVLLRYFIIKNNLSERVLRQRAIAMNNLATPSYRTLAGLKIIKMKKNLQDSAWFPEEETPRASSEVEVEVKPRTRLCRHGLLKKLDVLFTIMDVTVSKLTGWGVMMG
jgi:hypothetical protein